MSGILGSQDLWIVGSRFMFQPNWYATGGTTSLSHRLIDIGTIDTASPTINPTKIELRDGASGVRKIIDTTITEMNESYEITTKNFSRDNLSVLFFSSAPKTVTDEAGAGVGECTIYLPNAAPLGTLFQLRNNSGTTFTNIPAFGVTTITNTTGVVTTTPVVVDAAMGIWKTGAAATSAGNMVVTYTIPTDVVNDRSSLSPQGGTVSRLQGTGYLYFSRNNYEYQDCREFKCQILPASASFSDTDYSSFKLTAKALFAGSDTAYGGIGGSTAPFGRLSKFSGGVI